MLQSSTRRAASEIGNGRTPDFFSVRSEEDFDALRGWLTNREFTDLTNDEGFCDRHGKPLIGLRQRVAGDDGKPNFRKRGIVWFTDRGLRAQARPIIESYAKAA